MLLCPHSAVICAAGAGTRMGCPKALCLLGHCSFLSSIVETLYSVCVDNIIVVVGAEAQRIRDAHANLSVQWVENADWQHTYMLESLLCGLERVPQKHAVIHWPVDCVDVHVEDLKHLMDTKAPLASLAYDGVPGHPMRLTPEYVALLRQKAPQYVSLRQFVDEFCLETIAAQHPALMNSNTPQRLDDYLKSRCPK